MAYIRRPPPAIALPTSTLRKARHETTAGYARLVQAPGYWEDTYTVPAHQRLYADARRERPRSAVATRKQPILVSTAPVYEHFQGGTQLSSQQGIASDAYATGIPDEIHLPPKSYKPPDKTVKGKDDSTNVSAKAAVFGSGAPKWSPCCKRILRKSTADSVNRRQPSTTDQRRDVPNNTC